MRKIIVGVLTLAALVFMISCENSSPVAPESGSELPIRVPITGQKLV
jgi:hypothetical protein